MSMQVNIETFNRIAAAPEPSATLYMRRFIRLAAAYAMKRLCPEPRAYPNGEVRDAMAKCYPEIWRAWREWAGPGSDTIECESFYPVRFAATEAFLRLWMETSQRDGEVMREAVTLAELDERMRADDEKRQRDFDASFSSYDRWLADNPHAVRYAAERMALAGMVKLEGDRLYAGEALTVEYLKGYIEAWKHEAWIREIEDDEMRKLGTVLQATGSDTLHELHEKMKHLERE